MAQQTFQNCQWAYGAQNMLAKWPYDLEKVVLIFGISQY
jgi:hypothetical protein